MKNSSCENNFEGTTAERLAERLQALLVVWKLIRHISRYGGVTAKHPAQSP
ncbi:hypothetical protein KCP70_12725 [Salmonella enterica subsp. enterica]|nr:hypothetical protein KCP70_12725 [Salmonella enterica subsp. enterica]